MVSQLRSTFVPLFVLVLGLWGASQVGTASRAFAQNADKAAAEALFDRGLSLLKEGKYAEACERLEQSQAIERGIGTMLYLAECYEKVGKTASAWALFREAASLAQAEGQVERADAGRRRAEKLEKGLSKLAVQVPSANKVPGLRITDNGSALLPTVWGLALPVDPGVHRIEARADGYLPWSSDVKVGAQADSAELRVPLLEKDPNAEAAAVATAPSPAETAAAASTSSPAPAAEPVDTGMSGQRVAGIVLGSIGVASILVGAVTGGVAMRYEKASEDRTRANGTCRVKSCDTYSDKAILLADTSTATWAIGGALVAAGLLTYFLAPKQKARADVAVRIDHQTAGLRVGGVF